MLGLRQSDRAEHGQRDLGPVLDGGGPDDHGAAPSIDDSPSDCPPADPVTRDGVKLRGAVTP
ncbi:hypothetical protein GCM10020216_058980 [Nonomuraea helvata]